MKKILFDTDMGSDIDDALALAYLLKEPQCELLGITTVSGNPVQRAEIASAICHSVGRDDIPIYPGLEGPILGKQLQPSVIQYEKIGEFEHRSDFDRFSAIEFMRKTVRENPHEVTLLAVGPMTNIEVLFATDPEIQSLLEGLVVMCGNFDKNSIRAEWNAKCDWVATKGMYNAKVKQHRSYGLNVTLQLTLSRKEVESKFTGEVMKPVKAFAERWFNGKDINMIFHDPLAAAAIFYPDLCTYKRGNVKIGVDNFNMKGTTVFEEDENGRHEIAVTVDKDRFFDVYLNTVNR